ncbi:hypothetical protein D3C86_1098720 [compost metagenome]
MDWKEQLKRNPVIAGLIGVVAVITTIGTFAGAINSILELFGQDVFTSPDGLPVSTYHKLTGWLSTEVVLPAWTMLAALAAASIAIAYLLYQRSRLAYLAIELDALKNPPLAELDSSDERVLFWVRKIYDSKSTGVGPTPAVIASVSDIPLMTVETVLDVLKRSGLVQLKRLKSDPVDLTSKGRLYFAKPDVLSRYGKFEFNTVFTRI